MSAACRVACIAAWLFPAAGAAGTGIDAQPALAGIAATITNLRWLAGTWVTEAAGARIEERWTPPAGGAMLGTGRTLRGARMAGFEFLRIVTRNDTLIYVAQPGGRPPTEFPLTATGPGLAVFENPAHDFPRRLRYRRSGQRLDVELEGVEGGTPTRQTYTFTLARSDRN